MSKLAFSTLSVQDRKELAVSINNTNLTDLNKKIVAELLSFYDELLAKLKSPHANIKEIKRLLGIAEAQLKKLGQIR